MHRSKRCFIPPVAELSSYHDLDAEGDGPPKTASSILIARPRWVWIWYLPRLKHLALTSEFAYRFEFKMLQGCPALEYLRLHMRTTDRHHARVISEKDLYLHGVASPFRIVVPQVAQALHERSLVHRESLGTAARVSWSDVPNVGAIGCERVAECECRVVGRGCEGRRATYKGGEDRYEGPGVGGG